jgi:ankyrin repeat protein
MITVPLTIILFEFIVVLIWYLVQIIIVAYQWPLGSEQSVFHTRCCDIDTYFPLWITKVLLRFINVNYINRMKNTSLSYACMWSDYEKIKLLLLSGANPNGESILDLAVWHNDLKMMDLLLQYGAISTVQPSSFDALYLLLKYNHNPNTYIENECDHNNKKNIKLLIDYGADPEIVRLLIILGFA